MMKNAHGFKKSAVFFCLFVFLFVTIAIQFCHTEKTLRSNYQCPACHFLSSSLSAGIVIVFVLPQIIPLESLIVADILPDENPLPADLLSRSPPQA